MVGVFYGYRFNTNVSLCDGLEMSIISGYGWKYRNKH